MASAEDPKCPTTIDDVLHAFRTERAYQLRRWGYRQPDGSLTEAPHSVADFVCYIQDYFIEALHNATRDAGVKTSLDTLRKVICLGFACIEQCDWQDGKPYTFDAVADRIRNTGRIVQLTLEPCYSNYMLKIMDSIGGATMYAAVFNTETALANLHEMVQIGVECFSQYGIEPRDLSQPVINGRDGLPA